MGVILVHDEIDSVYYKLGVRVEGNLGLSVESAEILDSVISFEDYPVEIQSLRLSNVLHFLMKYIVHSFLVHNMILVVSVDQKIY